VQGTAAHLVDTRIPELRAALSQEGLSLGNFQSGGGNSGAAFQGGQAQDSWPQGSGSDPRPFGTPPAVTGVSETMKTTTKPASPKRRVHVTA
jgi:hypothetical protein